MDRANEFRAAAREISAAVIRDAMGTPPASERRYAATVTTAEKLAEFQATKFELATEQRELARGSDHEREELRNDGERARQVFMGNANTSVGRQVLYAAQVAQARNDREEKERKRSTDDVVFLLLLDQLADIDAEIDKIQGDMDRLNEVMSMLATGEMDLDQALQDEVVKKAIRDWEQRTGKKFDPDADDAEQVLRTILDEQRDVYQVKVDDLTRRRGAILDEIESIERRRAAGAELGDVKKDVQDIVAYSYEGADISDYTFQDKKFVEMARVEKDAKSDLVLDEDAPPTESEEAFSGFGSLEEVADRAPKHFAAAAAGVTVGPDPAVEPSKLPQPIRLS